MTEKKYATPRLIAEILVDTVNIHPDCIFTMKHQDRISSYLRSLVGYLSKNITAWSWQHIMADLGWKSRHSVMLCISKWVEVKHSEKDASIRVLGVTYTPDFLEGKIIESLRDGGYFVPETFDYDPFLNPEFESRQSVPWLD